MAKRPRLTVDKTELVYIDTSGKRAAVRNLPYDKIQRIQFRPIEERKFFKKVPSECIEIFASGTEKPYVLKKSEHEPFFEGYKEKIKKFAENNHRTFQNDLTE